MLGVVSWGLHMGLTQALLATLASDASPVELRGTAFGFFELASGFTTPVASMIAGTRSRNRFFVPRGAHTNEGDGYLLATIYSATEKRSDLAIFDAMMLADGPIALAELSHRVTLGFHGNWMAA